MGDDVVGDVVVNGHTQEDDPVFEEARVDIVGALASAGLLVNGYILGVHGIKAAERGNLGVNLHRIRHRPIPRSLPVLRGSPFCQ